LEIHREEALVLKKPDPAFRFMLAGLIISVLACSTLTGSGIKSGGESGGSDGELSDNLPAETHPGDYISYMGYFFAVLQVRESIPAAGSISPGKGNVSLDIVTGNQNGDFSSPFSISFGGISDGNGHTYGQVFGNSGAGVAIDLTGFLDRGERARGWVEFSMPEGSHPISLEISIINPVGGWKKFSYGLTPPADGYSPIRVDTSRNQPEMAAFGKSAEGQGCSFTALTVQDNLDSIPNIFFTLPPDSRVIEVRVEIRSTKNSELIIRDVGIMDGDGYVHRMSASETIMGQGRMTVSAGGTLEDSIYFVVPSGFTPDSIRLICNAMSNPMENIVLRSALS
jgi:hypothetical protein